MQPKEIKEVLNEMLPLIKEVLEMPEVKDLVTLYMHSLLKNKAVEEYNNEMIDRLATAIAKAQK